MKNKKRKGYTLLEILVVVVIIGALTYISVPMYNKIINKSDVSDALHKIDMFSGAESKYFIQNGSYTGDLGGLETPLKGDSEEILTARFNYSAGDPSEDNYCVYAKSTSKDYVLGRNYKTNSEVLCSGTDCDKISSIVKEGSLSELCGGNFNDECDRVCKTPKVLDKENCVCSCITATCNSNQVLNEESCKCICSPAAIAACSGENQFLQRDCSCACKKKDCVEGHIWNPQTCKCEDKCELNDEICEKEKGKNFIRSPKECECICGLVEKDCSDDEYLDENECICKKKSDCDKQDEDCKKISEDMFLNDNCQCECKLNKDICAENYKDFDSQNCKCVEECNLSLEKCKDENPNYIFISTGHCKWRN